MLLSQSFLFGQVAELKGLWQTKSWVVSNTTPRQIEEYHLVKSDSEIGLNWPGDTTTMYSNWSFESDSTLTSGTYCNGCFAGASGSYTYRLRGNETIIRSAHDSKIIYEGIISKESIILK